MTIAPSGTKKLSSGRPFSVESSRHGHIGLGDVYKRIQNEQDCVD